MLTLLPRKPGLSESYSFLIFSSKKLEIDNAKIVFLLDEKLKNNN